MPAHEDEMTARRPARRRHPYLDRLNGAIKRAIDSRHRRAGAARPRRRVHVILGPHNSVAAVFPVVDLGGEAHRRAEQRPAHRRGDGAGVGTVGSQVRRPGDLGGVEQRRDVRLNQSVKTATRGVKVIPRRADLKRVGRNPQGPVRPIVGRAIGWVEAGGLLGRVAIV